MSDYDFWLNDDDNELLASVDARPSDQTVEPEEFATVDDLFDNNEDEPQASTSTRVPPPIYTQIGTDAILYDGAEAAGFHLSAGANYIYPTNFPVRQYQMNIVKSCLFKNTLVCLPTGLGKTFIAAVVMYNFYRWYPLGKVVFMAPTRPLVTQQIKACYSIMGIPPGDTTEMTGALHADERKALWKDKRVFFLTPQVLVNDLRSNICPVILIKCVVVDEAHKAVKDYAYCQVIKELEVAKCSYRVLALSATPGNDINAVRNVITNLRISALEMRGEDALDVAPYTHTKSIEKNVVELSPDILNVKGKFLKIYEKYAKKLMDLKALPNGTSYLSKFQILKAMEKFRTNPPRGIPPAVVGGLISDFTVCMTLAHALELLQIYGLRAFHSYLNNETTENSKAAMTRLKNDSDLDAMLKELKELLFPSPDSNAPYMWSHPKLQNLVEYLQNHFIANESPSEGGTKAMIFCQYRVVVSEIVGLLDRLKPQIRAELFIGQSSGKEKGMNQAKQLQIMKDFRDGKINCLVATCVAEEGLDIGEVDLIVLMEAHKSPVRLVQRLGRTGRKRKGKCVVLLTKGREEQKFHESMSTRKSYVANIINSKVVRASLCQSSDSMFPPGVKPVQQLVHIKIINTTPVKPNKSGKKQLDIRNCLVPEESPYLNDEELKKVKLELGSKKLEFRIVPKIELWPRKRGPKMDIGELLDDSQLFFEYNEYNTELHPTFRVDHTSKSKLLCHLINRSEGVILDPFIKLSPEKKKVETKKEEAVSEVICLSDESSAADVPLFPDHFDSFGYAAFKTGFEAKSDLISRLEKYMGRLTYDPPQSVPDFSSFKFKPEPVACDVQEEEVWGLDSLFDDWDEVPTDVKVEQCDPLEKFTEQKLSRGEACSQVLNSETFQNRPAVSQLDDPKLKLDTSPDADWNLDDLFADEDNQESLLGVTQMIDLIEKDEKSNFSKFVSPERERKDATPTPSGEEGTGKKAMSDAGNISVPPDLKELSFASDFSSPCRTTSDPKTAPASSVNSPNFKKFKPSKPRPTPCLKFPETSSPLVKGKTQKKLFDIESNSPCSSPLAHFNFPTTSSPIVKEPTLKRCNPIELSSSSEELSPIKKTKTELWFKKPEKTAVKKKRRRRILHFIDKEADESGVVSSDDSDNSSLDGFDASFIDDTTEEHGVTISHHYLQSVKSPTCGKFKIPHKMKHPVIYSQQVNNVSQDYENDSFCVGSEEEDETGEPSVLELAERELENRRKRKRQIVDVSTPSPSFKKFKRRPRRINSSSDSSPF